MCTAGLTDDIIGFAEWKSANPHKYGAMESSHAHGSTSNIWAEPVHDHDRRLPSALRAKTAEAPLESTNFAGFFDVSFSTDPAGPGLPKASTLTHSLDGKLIQSLSPPSTAMGRASSSMNPKSKRLPRL